MTEYRPSIAVLSLTNSIAQDLTRLCKVIGEDEGPAAVAYLLHAQLAVIRRLAKRPGVAQEILDDWQ